MIAEKYEITNINGIKEEKYGIRFEYEGFTFFVSVFSDGYRATEERSGSIFVKGMPNEESAISAIKSVFMTKSREFIVSVIAEAIEKFNKTKESVPQN